MNAIEIRGLRKTFGKKVALDGLDMTVPQGAIYGFIGENGSGKSTTEKIVCGLMHADAGSVRLFGHDHTNPGVRSHMGVLIEAPGCFPNVSVWNNMRMQASNLGIAHPYQEIARVLKLVRMEGAASNKFRNCSLGMRQRIGIAFALLGNPRLLVLDEPINGLDADGMRIMREVLEDVAGRGGTVLVSSHILAELEKVATHYGIIRHGRMVAQMTASELEADCRTYVALRTRDPQETCALLRESGLARVETDEQGVVRIYDQVGPEQVVMFLYQRGVAVSEVYQSKVGLEEYYTDLMSARRAS